MKQIFAATFIFITTNVVFKIWGLTYVTICFGAIFTLVSMMLAAPTEFFKWRPRQGGAFFAVPLSPEVLLPFLVPIACFSYLALLTYWVNTSSIFESTTSDSRDYLMIGLGALYGSFITAVFTVLAVNFIWAPFWTIGFALIVVGGGGASVCLGLVVVELVFSFQLNTYYLAGILVLALVGAVGAATIWVAQKLTPWQEVHLCSFV